MSFWAKAMVAARSAVSAPTTATTSMAAGLSTNTSDIRQTR